ncbi:hypothetical protein DL96DRAFT_1634482 [Flagelloscypha sp. PMI_526]|nr:hypothetical protein DL96DRAFT_1634482 [Flagelloscypha sp. PMI_526]
MLPWAAYVAIATHTTSQLSTSSYDFKAMERLQRSLIFKLISSLSQSSDMCNVQTCHKQRFQYISSFAEGIATGNLDSTLCCMVGGRTIKLSCDFFVDAPLNLEFAFNTSSRICSRCQNAMVNSAQDNREKFWDALPDVLGLTSWETVLSQRTKWLKKSLNQSKVCYSLEQTSN